MSAGRVLVVEDEYAVARDLELRLRLLGYDCAGRADNGPRAIELAEKVRPDVVLMDIQLIGEMDGIEAAVEIRRRRDVPVIFLTAYGEPSTLERAKQAEPYGYALKPFDDRELRIVLEMALAKHQVDRRLKRASARLEALWSISGLAGAAAETVNAHVLRALREMTGSPLSFLAEIDAGSGNVRLWISGQGREDEAAREADPGEGVVGMVTARGSEILNNRSEAMALCEGGPALDRVLAMPAFADGQVVSVAGVANGEDDYTQGDLMQMMSFRDGVQALMGRERAEVELRRQVDFSQRIFNSTDAHLAVVGPDGRIVEVNQAWRRFAEQNEAGDVESWGPGAQYCRPCGPSEPDAVTAHEACRGLKAVQRGERPYFELEYPCHSREEQRWFSMRVLPLQGRPGTALVSHTNITARKQAELTLQESEARYRRLFETMTQGVVYQDAEGNILSANPAAERILGLPLGEIVGKTSSYEGWEAVREDGTELPGGEHPAMVALREGRTVRNQVMGLHNPARGGRVWISITAVPLFEPGAARPHQVYTTFEDITARRKAEEERERLTAQLIQAQKMESIGRLAGGVAHDFNNMLTVINGHSQLAAAGLKVGDPLHARLKEIQKAGERATVLTRQLLAFSRKQVMQLRVIKLNEVVTGVRVMLERLVGEDIAVELALCRESPTVKADPHQLEQVLMNLVVNARDAMPQGGQLRIETSLAAPAKVDGRPEGACALLRVEDTGLGMDGETLRHAFEPFFTTKGTGKGTGLGLSMVQGIVEQSGGTIEVSSQPGRGTAFRIYLPLFAGSEPEAQKPAAAPAMGRGATILVVEDQEDVRKFVVAVLEAYGYKTIPAADAGEAMRICEGQRPALDLVLTDVVMPHTSGRELIERLKTLYPALKSVYMSGYSDDVITHHGLLAAGVHFVQKPFGQAELTRKIQEALSAG